MPDVPEPVIPERSPVLGRVVAFLLAALFVMVALGVLWVWHRSSREQAWREQVNAAEPFDAAAPSRTNR